MRVELAGVTKGPRGIALPETSLAFTSGWATLAVAETAQRPTVLGLIASGRMTPDSGTVTIDGAADRRALRRRIALVDAPDVSEPTPSVIVAAVVAEELMFAGRASDPISARRWMHAHDLHGVSRLPIADLAPTDRLRILLELATLREGVEALILVSPDRHGGDPGQWWQLALRFAARGFAVLAIAGESSSMALGLPTAAANRPRQATLRAGGATGGATDGSTGGTTEASA